ncbi:MAG: hypothetical protein PHQ74_10530 [Crocinitomicaceae bacterium]|nr:hypothetical protein [Crocinitomicaceae bacterium]
MKSLIILFCVFSIRVLSQDTLLVTHRHTFVNDSLTHTHSITYNAKHLPTYTISVDYKRMDTTEVYTSYNEKGRKTSYVVNGPYFREKWDTTLYTYNGDTTITSKITKNPHQIIEYLRKEDILGRQFFSSSKTYDSARILIFQKLDSTFYDDDNYSQISRGYRMYDFPKMKQTRQVNTTPSEPIYRYESNSYGETYNYNMVDIESFPLIETTNTKVKLQLTYSSVIQRNKQGQALIIMTKSLNKEYSSGKYEYDSLNRILLEDVIQDQGKKRQVNRYNYEIIGDTLIKTSWRTTYSADTVSTKGLTIKESIVKINDKPLWTQGYLNEELISEYYQVFDSENRLLNYCSSRKDKGKWTETRVVFEYKNFE